MYTLKLFQKPFKLNKIFDHNTINLIRSKSTELNNDSPMRTIYYFSNELVEEIISPIVSQYIKNWNNFTIVRADFIHIKEPFGLHWDAYYGSDPEHYQKGFYDIREDDPRFKNPWKSLFICLDDNFEEDVYNGTFFFNVRSFTPWEVDWSKEYSGESREYFEPGLKNMKLLDIDQNPITIDDQLHVTKKQRLTNFRHLDDEWISGLHIEEYIPWSTGDVIFNDTIQLHCGSYWWGQKIEKKTTLRVHYRDDSYYNMDK